ncbi:MAG: hypothetical protein RBR12_04425 [Sulfurospirillum cavolei]|nr:hypothetical protein [Sulfurospirillum cavolei]
MSKIVFLFGVVALLISIADAEIYKYEHRFILKKDEQGLVFINHKEVTKKPTADNPNNEYLLRLRWTLFTNDMLTLLVNYRGYPTQYILEKKYPLQNIVVPLLPVGVNPITSQTYARIQFYDFNQTGKTAYIDVSIADEANRIEVEFKPKKTE